MTAMLMVDGATRHGQQHSFQHSSARRLNLLATALVLSGVGSSVSASSVPVTLSARGHLDYARELMTLPPNWYGWYRMFEKKPSYQKLKK